MQGSREYRRDTKTEFQDTWFCLKFWHVVHSDYISLFSLSAELKEKEKGCHVCLYVKALCALGASVVTLTFSHLADAFIQSNLQMRTMEAI